MPEDARRVGAAVHDQPDVVFGLVDGGEDAARREAERREARRENAAVRIQSYARTRIARREVWYLQTLCRLILLME